MTRAGRKTDAATTLLMVLLILTAAKLLLERLLALMLPHDLHQNTRLLLSMAQEALLIGLPALLMRRGRSARTGTMRLSIGLLLCAAVLGLAMRALVTPLTQLWGNFLSAPERQIAAADSAGEWCLQLLALAVLPAVLEEALFRGVLLGGMNDDEIGDFVRLTAKKPWQVRFIELMPMGVCAAWPPERFLPAQEVLSRVPELRPAGRSGVAQLYRLPGAAGTVGLIARSGRGGAGGSEGADELRLLRGLHKNTHHGGREAQALPALGRGARAARSFRRGAGSGHPPGHPDEAGTAPHGRDRRHRDAPRDVCDRRMKMELTHFNEQGRARMVDVSEKAQTYRVARAAATVRMAKATMDRIREGSIGKGDVLAVAQVAGIMAAKKNSELIPMCHPLLLTKVDISFETEEAALHIRSEVRCHSETGVEMEALTAVSVAALTVYDMCKAVQRDMRIDGIRLLYKEGGKSGVYEAEE